MTTDRHTRGHGRPGEDGGAVPPWHARPVERVARDLGTDPDRGLSQDEAAARLARVGPNRLPAPGRKPIWKMAVEQFASLIVLFLVAAAAIALVAGETLEAVAILVVIAVNALVGFATELRATQSIEALHRLGAPTARVERGGAEARALSSSSFRAMSSCWPRPTASRRRTAGRERSPPGGRVRPHRRVGAGGEASGRRREARSSLAERATMAYLGTAVRAEREGIVVTELGRH